MKRLFFTCFICCMLVWHRALSFYVPGVAPNEFLKDQDVLVKAIKLTSIKTQLPYDYYSLPFCKPSDIVYKAENLGEVLRGDRIVSTPFEVKMKVNVSCSKLCQPVKLTADIRKKLIEMIEERYTVHLLVDNLPCATKFNVPDTKEPQYEHGYRLGFILGGNVYLNNHLKITLLYHTEDEENYRVVGFEVATQSIGFGEVEDKDGKQCKKADKKLNGFKLENKGEDQDVLWSYEVNWVRSDIKWASRWDKLLAMSDSQIHWFSIVNSLVVVLFLAGVLAMIIIRTLRRDIAHYNKLDEDMDETLEETGWKLVHGDVFRPPPHPIIFSAIIGTGVQIFLMAVVTLAFACLGMLSPASRGALMTAALFLYSFMGLIGGYYSARLYRTLRGTMWRRAAFCTASLFPGVVFGVCFILNFFIWGESSSGAVPFTTMLALSCMWLGISTPLTYLGYYFGFRKQPYEHPVRTNQIPRQVPDQQWYLGTFISMLMAGLLPFGAMFIELFFIFTAIWENRFYYMFGFLFLVFIILVVSTSQISIVLVYFQLCAENYHWWWRSFLISGGCAIYVFAYSIFYFVTKLEITEFVPTMLYFGYCLLMVFAFWLFTGTIGFYASYIFIKKIYGAIKID